MNIFQKLKIILLILILKIESKNEVTIETPIPKNGTFVFSEFSDSSCTNLQTLRGFIPDSGQWNYPISNIQTMILISYLNETGELKYKYTLFINKPQRILIIIVE